MKRVRLALRASILVVVLASCLLPPTVRASGEGNAATTTRLSEARVLQIARVFCRKVGLAITAPGTAEFVPNPDINPGSYWQSRWQVEFPGQAQVEVADATGVVTEFSNERYSIAHSHDTDPPGKAISEQEAVHRSKEALDATGQRELIKFRHAEVFQMSYHPYAKTCFWFMDWDRMRQGVPYRDQRASVGTDAQTGEIQAVVLIFPTPPLASAVQTLSREDAMGRAAAIIVDRGIERSASHTGTRLEIIQPRSDVKTLRLAWASTSVVDGHWWRVYVDAETGETLGDGGDRTPNVKAPPPPPLAQMLKTVDRIYLRRQRGKTGGAAKPFFRFSANDQPHAAALLNKTTDFRAHPIAEVASEEMVLVNKDGAIGVYPYQPETGVLGGGPDQAVVPDEFKVWLQRRIKAGAGTR